MRLEALQPAGPELCAEAVDAKPHANDATAIAKFVLSANTSSAALHLTVGDMAGLFSAFAV